MKRSMLFASVLVGTMMLAHVACQPQLQEPAPAAQGTLNSDEFGDCFPNCVQYVRQTYKHLPTGLFTLADKLRICKPGLKPAVGLVAVCAPNHVMIVTRVVGDNITCRESNWSGNCAIGTRTMKASTIRGCWQP